MVFPTGKKFHQKLRKCAIATFIFREEAGTLEVDIGV